MRDSVTIYVYADFLPHRNEPIGRLSVTRKMGRETCSFVYDESWLRKGVTSFDPDLELYADCPGTENDMLIMEMFFDSCPDSWGQSLINERERRLAERVQERPSRLTQSEYVLSVSDEARMGALRFKTDPRGPFLSDAGSCRLPVWTDLARLETACRAWKDSRIHLDEQMLSDLLFSGSCLGGSRPKACVKAYDQSLWIAKFPCIRDWHDIGAWEMVAHDLALLCGLHVPEAKLLKFSDSGSTFLAKRFDREGDRRVHFSSAMSMLRKAEGANAEDRSSYLEIVSFLQANGAAPRRDLPELWKRIVFSMAVSNTDDHLKNHGFLLTRQGWVLSPLFDVNPELYGDCLSLTVDGYSSLIDFDLAVDAAPLYRMGKDQAKRMVEKIRSTVTSQWRDLAKKYRISREDIETMSQVFEKRP